MLRCASAVLTLLVALGEAQSSVACYDYTGNEAADLGACDLSSSVSSCCPWGEICYSNGLCRNPYATTVNATEAVIYLVFGCTEAGGNTGECYAASKCLGTGAGRGVGVTACGDNRYCCYGLGGCDCNNATSVFTLDSGKAVTTLPTTSVVQMQATTQSSTTGVSSASMTSTVPTTTTTSGTASTFTYPASTSISASPAAAASSSNSTAIGAGMGVAVGVLVLAAILVTFFIIRRRRRRQQRSLPQPIDYSASQDSHYYKHAPQESVYRAEMSGQGVPAQLDAREPTELPGSRPPVYEKTGY